MGQSIGVRELGHLPDNRPLGGTATGIIMSGGRHLEWPVQEHLAGSINAHLELGYFVSFFLELEVPARSPALQFRECPVLPRWHTGFVKSVIERTRPAQRQRVTPLELAGAIDHQSDLIARRNVELARVTPPQPSFDVHQFLRAVNGTLGENMTVPGCLDPQVLRLRAGPL